MDPEPNEGTSRGGTAASSSSASGFGSSSAALLRLLEQGWAFHPAAGHLSVRLSGVAVSAEALSETVLPALARLIATECRTSGPAAEAGSGASITVRKARVDLSGAGLSDEALKTFLRGWCALGLEACAMCLMLQRNRLTDASFRRLGDFAASEAIGAIEELHASHQAGPEPVSRGAVLYLLERLARSSKYPIWVKRTRSYRPVHLRLGHCGVETPDAVAKELEVAAGTRVCFADDAGCVRTACVQAKDTSGCPVAHLFDFRSQERPIAEAQDAPVEPEVLLARSEADPRKRQRGKAFLCGSCGRELPIDMFTRSQFQKAVQMDEERSGEAGAASLASPSPRWPPAAHLVRRCNDCVTQPCCACGEEMPLSAFANTQMYRPNGSRRCRRCAADTWLCARCGRPKTREEFSLIEATKRKQMAKICQVCESRNPYFERRYAICAIFSGKHSGPPAWIPALAREVLCRILDFAREARFVKITQRGFECKLCARSWSLLTSGDDHVERHIRTSQVHARRLRSVESGNLVEIESTGLEASRFSEGLGIRGVFCGRQQVAEARELVDLSWETGLSAEALRAVGCVRADRQMSRWATAMQVQRARTLFGDGEGEGEDEEPAGTDGGGTSAAAAAAAARSLGRKLHMLCTAGRGLRRPRDDDGYEEEEEEEEDGEEDEYQVDQGNLDEVRRFLLLGDGG